MKARKFKVIGNSNHHGFDIGDIIIARDLFGNSVEARAFDNKNVGWYIRFEDLKEINEKPNIIQRICTSAIAGLLFCANQHAKYFKKQEKWKQLVVKPGESVHDAAMRICNGK